MIFLIKRCFDDEKYQFTYAKDGIETLERIRKDKPDLILLDLKMPKKNGIEVLSDLKSDRTTKDIPVIVLTVTSDTYEKVKALKNGASDYLVKPPEPSELKARVETHLNLSQAKDSLKRYSKELERIVDNKTQKIKEYANKLEDMVQQKVGVIKRQNSEMLFNLESAKRIQNCLLRVDFPKIKGIEFFSKYMPCDIAGGDLFDVFQIDEDTLGIVIADVSGHGIPSAMITIYIKQEITYLCKKIIVKGNYQITSPKEVLKSLNDSIIDKNICEGKYFVTMVYCTYSISKGILTLSSAGHHALPIIKRQNGNIEIIRMEGFPLGWFKEKEEYDEKSYKLHNGDSILFYTDGIFEIMDDSKESFNMVKRSVISLLDSNNIIREIERQINIFIANGKKIDDDITLLLMKIKKHS